jgi:cold-inducible RNA-binding protein
MKLYVGNLAYGATENDLRGLFARHGTVESAVVMKDPGTGRSNGFGFVNLTNVDAARAAIADLNGRDVVGQTLSVSLASTEKKTSSHL